MIPPTSPIHALLDANVKWADAVNHADPAFFHRSAMGQFPKVLWIGCADSRVPESVLTAARPGDIFVHRNIANQCHPDDDSANAVLSYAVGVLGVEHVVVAGHTQCGGAAACYQAATTTPPPALEEHAALGRWLAPLTALVGSLDLASTPPESALDLIVRENVKHQVQHVCAAQPIQDAWNNGRHVSVHGWVYDVASGRLNDLAISRGPFGVPVRL